MKRFVSFIAIIQAVLCLQAAPVSESAARQVADQFFAASTLHHSSKSSAASTRLAYRADQGRFYIYDRGASSGFVVVAGDDRLPQVLGYGAAGDFTSSNLPPAVSYWMSEMDREIAYLQSHSNATAHHPIKRATAVGPLMTTRWDQGEPYNDLCPTYTDNNGTTARAVTGCVATATAQVMNYHQWPPVGRGNHTYTCNVNDMTYTELSADFSQSVYRWDLMLDDYTGESSTESREAVAKLMSDVGIAVDMGYGSSSGASETVAMHSLRQYFNYSEKSYLLNRDYYTSQEWDQFLVDELAAGRPIIYCGYDFSTNGGGHAFVFDGYDSNGYFHVNWGWGGHYDGYFLSSVLNPGTSKFNFMQDAMMGVIPEPQGDVIPDVMYVRTYMYPAQAAVPLGKRAPFVLSDLMAQGNMVDTTGMRESNGRTQHYCLIPMSLAVIDSAGVERESMNFNYELSLDDNWWNGDQWIYPTFSTSLEDGQYLIKLSHSVDGKAGYNHPVLDFTGKEAHVQMIVRNDTAYLRDCFLTNIYSVDAIDVPPVIRRGQPFTVDVTMLGPRWGSNTVPTGNVYLSIVQEDGTQVASSQPCEVMVPQGTARTYQIQITAPTQVGVYYLVLHDESGNLMDQTNDSWFDPPKAFSELIYVMPPCQELVEDFETMTANNSSNDKNVPGRFITWNFTKSGVRSPGEGRCHGTNSVMMKTSSIIYTAEPLTHNIFMAQATIFNPSTSVSKFVLEYSVDGGEKWLKALTLDKHEVAEVPEKSQTIVRWPLDVPSSQPAILRLAMTGGGSGSNYVDDIVVYCEENNGDVNMDGMVNIADINLLIHLILTGGEMSTADVNGDGVINIADINVVINSILN